MLNDFQLAFLVSAEIKTAVLLSSFSRTMQYSDQRKSKVSTKTTLSLYSGGQKPMVSL